jgi:dTDP-glucose 4,6-dehydratase
VDRSLRAPLPFVHTNVRGVLVLLEEARRAGVKRFLQVSTDEVYGDLAGTDAHSVETDPFHPRSPYAATKASAEHLAMSYHVSYDLPVVITRGSNTYGPRQYPEKIIPFFIARAVRGEPLPLYGDGSAVRDYMHVEDHARGVHRVLTHGEPGEAYNLGARLEVPGTEVAEGILKALGRPATAVEFVPDRPGHDYRYSVDPSKAEAVGWERRHSFEEGLPETVRWYVDNADWVQRRLESKAHAEHTRAWYRGRTDR